MRNPFYSVPAQTNDATDTVARTAFPFSDGSRLNVRAVYSGYRPTSARRSSHAQDGFERATLLGLLGSLVDLVQIVEPDQAIEGEASPLVQID